MGWSQGHGLGAKQQGRVDPIPHNPNPGFMGLGKATLDARMLSESVFKRRDLESEKQALEDEDQRKKREEGVRKKEEVKQEIQNTLKAFYCEECDKGYKNVSQYNEHLNSYDHHHKVRFADMKRAERAKAAATGELAKKREKERKREERELAKLMGSARGGGSVAAVKPSPIPVPVPLGASSGSGGGFKSLGSGGGFKPMGGGGGGGFKPLENNGGGGGGFKAVGSAGFKSIGTANANTDSPPKLATNAFGAPAFQSSGYKKLDLDSSGIIGSPPSSSKPTLATTTLNIFAPAPLYNPPPGDNPPPPPPGHNPPPDHSSPPPPAIKTSFGSFKPLNKPPVSTSRPLGDAMDIDTVESLLEGPTMGGKPKMPKTPKVPKKSGGGSAGWQAWKKNGR
ncbi:hypothetical protein BT69DRAFT_1278186 [Atractiella rhizophila]|nr:hypothetical protein BT69DRAFT_1278186 [Atractiella rhizophila]